MNHLRVWSTTVLCLVIALGAEAAVATWDRNPESDVLGYVLAYGTQSGVYTTEINVGNVLTYEFFPPPGFRYYVVVRAYSALGSGPNSTEVVLDLTTTTPNQPPTLTQPPNQTSLINQVVSLTLVGSDPEGAALTYSATGLPPGLNVAPSTGVIAGTATATGTFSVMATVSDGSLTASRSFTWRITQPTTTDTTPPVVAITAPSSGSTVRGKTVTVAATASDAGGVAGVLFLVDGAPIAGEDTVSPYNAIWNSTAATNGTHQLTAVARDTAGNTRTSSAVVVTVRNGGRRSTTETAVAEPEQNALSATAEPEPSNVAPAEPADVAVAADFDGDGRLDPAVYHAATGEWRLFNSSAPGALPQSIVWGAAGDVPVPADYDGDRRADLAVYRPSTGTWHVLLSSSGMQSRLELPWGDDTVHPMAFDHDGDGRADLAVLRNGGLEILLSSSDYASSVVIR